MVPSLERSYGQLGTGRNLSGGGEVLAAHAEARRDEVADDPLVERIARDGDAVGADDVRERGGRAGERRGRQR